jgi:hypothetical protein
VCNYNCISNTDNQSIVAKPNANYRSSPVANDPVQNYANIPEPEARQIGAASLQSNGSERVFPNFQKRQFSYDDLRRITDGFKNNIGTGGFGGVYLGMLEDNFKVAVKMRSHSSQQGDKEFLAEVCNHQKPSIFARYRIEADIQNHGCHSCSWLLRTLL